MHKFKLEIEGVKFEVTSPELHSETKYQQIFQKAAEEVFKRSEEVQNRYQESTVYVFDLYQKIMSVKTVKYDKLQKCYYMGPYVIEEAYFKDVLEHVKPFQFVSAKWMIADSDLKLREKLLNYYTGLTSLQ